MILCEITQMPLGTCACAQCRPDLKQYQPVPEVWTRVTEAASAHRRPMRVVPPPAEEAVKAMFEAAPAGTPMTVFDMARELCETTKRREPYYLSLTGKTLHHPTISPALIVQLYDAVAPSSSAATGGIQPAGSRPAARLDAIDTAVRIETDAARWLRKLGEDDSDEVIVLIRRLTPFTITEHELGRDIRRWWTWARIVTGWDLPAWQPDNTCPICGTRGSLRIRLVEKLATCINDACRETWDEATIGLLADHIRTENHEDEEAS